MPRKHDRPLALENVWKTLARVAAPYSCRSCGWRYNPALSDEVDNTAKQFMREVPSLYLGITALVHDRFNAFLWCDNPSCSRYYDHAKRGLPPRLTMRRKWLPPEPAANDRTRKEHEEP